MLKFSLILIIVPFISVCNFEQISVIGDKGQYGAVGLKKMALEGRNRFELSDDWIDK